MKTDYAPLDFSRATTKGEKFLTRKIDHSDREFRLKVGIILAVAILAGLLYLLVDRIVTPIAHANSPEDVQGLEAQCAYAGLYPEKIVNLGELQVACADNHTPVVKL